MSVTQNMRTPAKKWLYNLKVGGLQLKSGFAFVIITADLLFSIIFLFIYRRSG